MYYRIQSLALYWFLLITSAGFPGFASSNNKLSSRLVGSTVETGRELLADKNQYFPFRAHRKSPPPPQPVSPHSPPPFTPAPPGVVATVAGLNPELAALLLRSPIDATVEVDAYVRPPVPDSCPKARASSSSAGACSGHGTCNELTGKCLCRSGWAGEACEVAHDNPCNTPDGAATTSRCAGECDVQNNKCYCGEGSRYPNRPMRKCVWDGVEKTMPFTDLQWDGPTFGEKHKFWGTNRSWCDAQPDLRGEPLITCQCYDGSTGKLCATRTEQTCLNHCSHRGTCEHGFCRCREGAFGVDCSLTSSDPPKVKLHRPLIYVYELPGEFNIHHSEQRIKQEKCQVRYYEGGNETRWVDNLYGAETALHEALLASPHRTTNPDIADFFFVPVWGSCYMSRFISATAGHRLADKLPISSPYHAALEYRKAHEYISTQMPYWGRRGGRDHLWMLLHDEGACFAPKEIWPSIMLVHWGRDTGPHPVGTHSFNMHVWDHPNATINAWMRAITADHTCYDPAKDIVIPAWRNPGQVATSPHISHSRRSAAPGGEKYFFFFRGDLGLEERRAKYSMGIRQKAHAVISQLGQRDVVMDSRGDHYHESLASSRFCGVFPGNGWSGRFEEALLHGCIPVIVQDNVETPFDRWIDTRALAVRIKEADIPNMIDILRKIPIDQVFQMQHAIRQVWSRMLYTSIYSAESKFRSRKQLVAHDMDERVIRATHGKLDAVDTLMQILWYKKQSEKGG